MLATPMESTIELSQDIVEVLVSLQQVLVQSGYRYLSVDAARWPGTSVLMSHNESPLLIDIWPREPAAGVLAHWQDYTLREKNAGLLLIGSDDIHDRAVDDFFQTTRGALGYIDARTRQFRLSTLPTWVQQPPDILRELYLARALTPQSAADATEVDCRNAISRDTQEAELNRDYSAETAKLHGAKRAPFTHLLIFACVLIYLGTILTSEYFSTPQAPAPLALSMWGALDGSLIRQGEWWRMLTAAFLHGDNMHLFSNMLVFYWLAAPLEYQQGSARLAACFFYSVITGYMLSLLCMPHMKAVGASGGIFGLVGVYAAMPVRFRAEMPPAWRVLILKCLVAILCYSALIALEPGIDWVAHLGGLLGGFVIALLLLRSPLQDSPRSRWNGLALAALLAVTVLLAVLLVRRIS